MNYLFYVGIILPTVITFVLFLIFIYCWFLQKARREVLTAKYDPHGKMRRLGISMEPPPPPDYCRTEDALLPHGGGGGRGGGEDNGAYNVSRSPSTEQEARERPPMYRTYHDSGISAGLSPSLENEPGLSYRTCPDSGISGFSMHQLASVPYGPQQHQHQQQQQQQQQQPQQQLACRGCCQSRDQQAAQFIPPPRQQLCLGNELQIHYEQGVEQQPQHFYPGRVFPAEEGLQPQQEYRNQHQQQAVLHQTLMQASVHPSHGLCYGDDMNHPQSPHHYNPPPIQQLPLHPSDRDAERHNNMGVYHQQHHTLMHHDHFTTTGEGRYGSREVADSSECHIPGDDGQRPAVGPAYPPHPPPPQYPSSPGGRDHHMDFTPLHTDASSRQLSPGSRAPLSAATSAAYNGGNSTKPHSTLEQQQHLQHFPTAESSTQPTGSLSSSPSSSSSSPSSQPPSTHSYRDSGVVVADVVAGQSAAAGTGGERPDSQASHSSTTDSEDSGFRSSHCAVTHNNQLTKQGNPLLKPFRRARTNTANHGNNNTNSTTNNTRNTSGNKPPRNASSNSDDSTAAAVSVGGAPTAARPPMTLNPQNLQQPRVDSGDVIHPACAAAATATTTTGDLATQHSQQHRSPGSRVHQHQHKSNGGSVTMSSPPSMGMEGGVSSSLLPSPGTSRMGPPTTSRAGGGGSPSRRAHPRDHSPSSRENWPPQSVNEDEISVKQSIDMTDISTHLSWKYLQDFSSPTTAPPTNFSSSSNISNNAGGNGLLLQQCHQGLRPGQFHPGGNDQHNMEIFGYSVV